MLLFDGPAAAFLSESVKTELLGANAGNVRTAIRLLRRLVSRGYLHRYREGNEGALTHLRPRARHIHSSQFLITTVGKFSPYLHGFRNHVLTRSDPESRITTAARRAVCVDDCDSLSFSGRTAAMRMGCRWAASDAEHSRLQT